MYVIFTDIRGCEFEREKGSVDQSFKGAKARKKWCNFIVVSKIKVKIKNINKKQELTKSYRTCINLLCC